VPSGPERILITRRALNLVRDAPFARRACSRGCVPESATLMIFAQRRERGSMEGSAELTETQREAGGESGATFAESP